MAPLSVLPGRVRFESSDITGRVVVCRHLQNSLRGMDGLLGVSVNSRTGRILVEFNEDIIDRHAIRMQIDEIIKSAPLGNGNYYLYSGRGREASSGIIGYAVLEMLARSVLPRPFNVLLPLAVKAIKG